jgi:hypothetical protein
VAVGEHRGACGRLMDASDGLDDGIHAQPGFDTARVRLVFYVVDPATVANADELRTEISLAAADHASPRDARPQPVGRPCRSLPIR